ncbi:hypothetical protein [Trichormus azollae]|jgi:hypothetical protein|uniref:Uncharacterized protein n=1 Tax=Nostoc azollae (strain 0708) TaxID=551115 RepID=D7E389_NOSA0|nr:hypothetical protein [Trichormus azollae]ADI63512.1 hypothetical protein Aazo_1192 ['Nostoc azollae' 0708]
MKWALKINCRYDKARGEPGQCWGATAVEGFPGIKHVVWFRPCRRFAFPQGATGEPEGQ